LNPENFSGSTLLSVSCGEICLLISWFVGDRCGMVGSDEDQGRSSRLGAEDQRLSSTGWVLDGQTIESSGDVVCGLHRTHGYEEHEILGLASKPRSTVSPGLASKPVAMVLVVWPQNLSLRFSVLYLKTGRCDLVIWPTKSPR
jgi:hypothetical protein